MLLENAGKNQKVQIAGWNENSKELSNCGGMEDDVMEVKGRSRHRRQYSRRK